MIKSSPFLALTSLCLIAVGGVVDAADPAPAATLPEVVVTGSNEPPATPQEPGSLLSPDFTTAQALLHETPAAVTAVSDHHFDRSRGAYLEDYITMVPGVLISSSQGAEDTKISIRGSNAQEDDIIGLGVILDGLPLNEGDGEAVLQDMDLHAVKYAEVYRGADALRYGSATLGGAINFVTMTGHDAPLAQVWLTAGSWGFIDEGLVSSYAKGPFDVLFTLSNHNLEGYRDHSTEDTQKLFLSLGYQINENTENRLYLFGGHFFQETPSSLSKDEMYRNPKQTDPDSIEQNWYKQWTYFRIADRFVVKGNDWDLQIGAFYAHRNARINDEFTEDSPEGIDKFFSDDFGISSAYNNVKELFGHRNRFTVGVTAAMESETDKFYENIGGQPGNMIASDKTLATNLAVYSEDQFYLTKSFSVLAGFQGAFSQRYYRDYFVSPENGNQTTREDFLAFNPKLGAMYEWNDDTCVYMNVSRSFQPPSFDQSLETDNDGNRIFNELNAQKAITLEAGFRGKAGRFSWDAALYHSWLRDELLDLTNGDGQVLGTINVPKSYHQGIEAGLEIDIYDGLIARGDGKQDRIVLEQTYTLSDFHFQDDPTYGDNRIAGTPVNFYKAELRYEHPCGFYCGANVEWNITKYPVDEANTLYADPYALLGARIGYRTKKGLEVFFEAKNLTNKIYAATVDPVGNAQIEGGDSFNPGNGRSFYAGVSWKW